MEWRLLPRTDSRALNPISSPGVCPAHRWRLTAVCIRPVFGQPVAMTGVCSDGWWRRPLWLGLIVPRDQPKTPLRHFTMDTTSSSGQLVVSGSCPVSFSLGNLLRSEPRGAFRSFEFPLKNCVLRLFFAVRSFTSNSDVSMLRKEVVNAV